MTTKYTSVKVQREAEISVHGVRINVDIIREGVLPNEITIFLTEDGQVGYTQWTNIIPPIRPIPESESKHASSSIPSNIASGSVHRP